MSRVLTCSEVFPVQVEVPLELAENVEKEREVEREKDCCRYGCERKSTRDFSFKIYLTLEITTMEQSLYNSNMSMWICIIGKHERKNRVLFFFLSFFL